MIDLKGLSEQEAQQAINTYVNEKNAAQRRGREQRKSREAYLRRQGYSDELDQ